MYVQGDYLAGKPEKEDQEKCREIKESLSKDLSPGESVRDLVVSLLDEVDAWASQVEVNQ